MNSNTKLLPKIISLVSQHLAAEGRGGDQVIAHLSPGEVVIPRALVLKHAPALSALFAADGWDPMKFLVGAEGNSRNPDTGLPEFFGGGGSDAADTGGADSAMGGGDAPGDGGGAGASGMGGGFGGDSVGAINDAIAAGFGPEAPGYGSPAPGPSAPSDADIGAQLNAAIDSALSEGMGPEGRGGRAPATGTSPLSQGMGMDIDTGTGIRGAATRGAIAGALNAALPGLGALASLTNPDETQAVMGFMGAMNPAIAAAMGLNQVAQAILGEPTGGPLAGLNDKEGFGTQGNLGTDNAPDRGGESLEPVAREAQTQTQTPASNTANSITPDGVSGIFSTRLPEWEGLSPDVNQTVAQALSAFSRGERRPFSRQSQRRAPAPLWS